MHPIWVEAAKPILMKLDGNMWRRSHLDMVRKIILWWIQRRRKRRVRFFCSECGHVENQIKGLNWNLWCWVERTWEKTAKSIAGIIFRIYTNHEGEAWYRYLVLKIRRGGLCENVWCTEDLAQELKFLFRNICADQPIHRPNAWVR